jgi:hypothetical protein
MILTEISPGHARLVLRVYFLIFVGIITWLADSILQSRAQLKIIRNGSIRVHKALGWLQGFQLLKSVYDLRQLPGGRLGYTMMVILFALSKVTDLLTTTFVVQVEVKSRCQFGEGLVLNTTGPFLTAAPPSNGIPYIVAHNAQYFSLNNTCPIGIYAKVNRDITFCPDTQDILDSWVCSTGDHRPYTPGYNQLSLAEDLINQGLLYPNATFEYSGFGGGYYNHLVAWSSSAALSGNAINTTWDVRAAIQTNASPFDDNVKMLGISCSMTAPPVETIIRAMNSTATLEGWKATFQGLMYYGTGTPSVTNPTLQLAILLNTLTMVQGGDNIILSIPAPNADQTQGCIVPATDVPPVIMALVLIVAGSFVSLIVVFLVYTWQMRFTHRGLQPSIKYLPDGVIGWTVKAAQEHRDSREPDDGQYARVRRREIKNWLIGYEDGQPRLRMLQPYR